MKVFTGIWGDALHEGPEEIYDFFHIQAADTDSGASLIFYGQIIPGTQFDDFAFKRSPQCCSTLLDRFFARQINGTGPNAFAG